MYNKNCPSLEDNIAGAVSFSTTLKTHSSLHDMVITAAHRQSQSQRIRQCVAGLLARNTISDGRGAGLWRWEWVDGQENDTTKRGNKTTHLGIGVILRKVFVDLPRPACLGLLVTIRLSETLPPWLDAEITQSYKT
ncbi:hypothetical protein EVAR_47167_1 [Eumeta japonica]|uniref:Uncharacterized protein n=1 Tax=Eumeta variegata TaxID=151549 RepID=A0A4C1WX75_EUMVA|nr:hypothetical protein EVAR_47167_1 [Eumeta japonica]